MCNGNWKIITTTHYIALNMRENDQYVSVELSVNYQGHMERSTRVMFFVNCSQYTAVPSMVQNNGFATNMGFIDE